MKKLSGLILCVTLLLSFGSVYASAFQGRPVEGASDWAKDDIRRMRLLFDSYWDFEYEDYGEKINREEFCEGVVKFANYLMTGNWFEPLKELTDRKDAVFEDTDSRYVERAFELGFVNGTSEGKFSPGRIVTREEAAVMFYRMFLAFGIDVASFPKEDAGKPQNVSEWAKDAVDVLWYTEAFGRILNNDETNPRESITKEEMFSAIWYYTKAITGEQLFLFYEDTKPEILVELGIVTSEDFEKDGFITEGEALSTINKIASESDVSDLSWWYGNPSFEEYDSLSDEKKKLLISLMFECINPVVSYQDIPNLDFDGDITYSDAYLYVWRCLMSSSGCMKLPPEYLVRVDDKSLYECMYEQELINSNDIQNSQASIPRREFYELLHKAIFYEFVNGGYIDNITRYVDRIQSRNAHTETVTHTVSKEIQLSGFALRNDLSVSWSFPEEIVTEESKAEDFMVKVDFLDQDGNSVSGYIFSRNHEIDTKYMLLSMVRAYPKVPVKIRVAFVDTLYTEVGIKNIEYWDELDISKIEVVESGEAPKPGTVRRPKNRRPLERMTLASGEAFEKDSWYLLTSYDHTYRKDEYNAVAHELFRATVTDDEFVPDEKSITVYADYPEDMHITKVMVEGSEKDGFVIVKTPESEGKFKAELF